MLDPQKTVLLVIDMQNGFLGSRSRHIIQPVLRLVQEFKRRGIPVVFTRFLNPPGSQYERLISWTRLRTSPETDLAPELQPFAETVFDKEVYSSLTPAFLSMLADKSWGTIVLCGVATDGCVLKSAVDVFERQLTPIVVSDACASHAGDETHREGLHLLERFIGKRQLQNTDLLLSELS